MIKRFIVFFSCIISLVLTLPAQQKSTEESIALFPVEVNGKWGYIDRSGLVNYKKK